MLAYPLTSVPLTFAHIDGLITDAPRNIDACIVDGMFLVQSRVGLPSTFGGQANMPLSESASSCQTGKSCRFCM